MRVAIRALPSRPAGVPGKRGGAAPPLLRQPQERQGLRGEGRVCGRGFVSLGAPLMNELAKRHVGTLSTPPPPGFGRSCETSRQTPCTERGGGAYGAAGPGLPVAAAPSAPSLPPPLQQPSARPCDGANYRRPAARRFAWGAPIGRGQPARARPTCRGLPLVSWGGRGGGGPASTLPRRRESGRGGGGRGCDGCD